MSSSTRCWTGLDVGHGRGREARRSGAARVPCVLSNQLAAYKHDGFWQPMDTRREKEILESLWKAGKAPWKSWE